MSLRDYWSIYGLGMFAQIIVELYCKIDHAIWLWNYKRKKNGAK